MNTLFADNQAGGGAAIDTVFATLRHVTIAGATLRAMPAIQATSGLVAITDTIVSNYTVGISQTGGLLSADYNLFFTATPTQTSGVTVTWGAHNLNVDPKFVNPPRAIITWRWVHPPSIAERMRRDDGPRRSVAPERSRL